MCDFACDIYIGFKVWINAFGLTLKNCIKFVVSSGGIVVKDNGCQHWVRWFNSPKDLNIMAEARRRGSPQTLHEITSVEKEISCSRVCKMLSSQTRSNFHRRGMEP